MFVLFVRSIPIFLELSWVYHIYTHYFTQSSLGNRFILISLSIPEIIGNNFCKNTFHTSLERAFLIQILIFTIHMISRSLFLERLLSVKKFQAALKNILIFFLGTLHSLPRRSIYINIF